MSKWNKPGKEPSEQFLQNQERRRQMIMEAAKRRREKQKKLQELNDDLKKKQEQALIRHKQQKKDAYAKYLRNNMHDKYEYKKRMQKMQEETIKDVSKWRRRGKSEEKVIEVPQKSKSQKQQIDHANVHKTVQNFAQSKPEVKVNPAKKAMMDEFQKQWGDELVKEEDDMISSKLLDSLDLDFDTVQRCQNINTEMKRKTNNEKQNQLNAVNEELQQIKEMIGYESMVGDSMMDLQSQIASRKEKSQIQNSSNHKKIARQGEKKQVNEQETFNNLKHKKQGKILEWAGPEAEQADDLFSHCSSKNNKISPIPEIINKVSSRKILQPIPEKKVVNRSEEKRNNNQNKSVQKRTEKKPEQKPKNNVTTPAPTVPNFRKQENRSQSRERKASVERKNVRQPINGPQPRSQERPRTNSNSHQKNQSSQNLNNQNQRFMDKKPPAKTQQSFKVHKNPPMPVIPRPTQSVATHQQFFDIESFIKHDLNNINEEQRRLQEQIRDLHIANKGRIKQVEQKYELKTNMKKTDNLLKHLHGEADGTEDYSGESYVFKNQNDIEDSIERLDDLLIRRDLQSREKPLTHISEESHLKSSGLTSIIDPLGRPQDLQKQILQLAENISRFEEEPVQDAPGYGYNKRMMKKKETPYEKPSITQNSHKYSEGYSKSKQNEGSHDFHAPPVLEYSGKQKNVENESLFQDSLDTMEKGKIQVNQKLKNLLFD